MTSFSIAGEAAQTNTINRTFGKEITEKCIELDNHQRGYLKKTDSVQKVDKLASIVSCESSVSFDLSDHQ
jgi:hypothetical protein